MRNLKLIALKLWSVEAHIRAHIRIARWLRRNVPILGKALSMLLDRALLCLYGIDLTSSSINIAALSISHPVGVLLGGNGMTSPGRVAIMAGVKFVAHSPSHEEYLRRHKEQRVFEFGDNVVIGANSVVIGPVRICDNVMVGAMSLVNRDIDEPGIYVGSPARKISDAVSEEWVNHLQGNLKG